MPKTAIIILNYNGKDYLKRFLPSVIDGSGFAEIVVADNASIDCSVPFLKKEFPEVRVVQLDQNYGYAGGYNRTLHQVTAKYYVILNSDVEVTPDWLEPIIDFLDKKSDYAVCQPKIRAYNQKDFFEYAGASGGFMDILGYPFCRGRIFDTIEKDNNQYNDAKDVFWASGACLVIRSEVFFQVGGFDEDFFAHMEEIDLCWRIQSCNLKIRSLPVSTVYHIGGGTLSKGNTFKTYLNFRNGLYLLVKNLPATILLWVLPVRILLDWIAAVKFLLDGNSRHSLAVLKAHTNLSLSFLRIVQKRKRTYAKGLMRNSIVYNYFIKGKKKYSDY